MYVQEEGLGSWVKPVRMDPLTRAATAKPFRRVLLSF
jgi:hypothetical protein